ncbi:MAG TPA: SGNH/GDSL hydrolase family protein [Jatrophihabitantaceae bacterium]|nr:SGNH/GDSL hydrolase family protein [Jatrophihabitantaceae bacterium]
MPNPLPLPMRILVKGASTVGWLGEMGGPPSDLGFPRAIEAALYRAGRPAEVRALTVASERTKTAARRWEREMVGYSPDVVILVYGHYETVHLFLPRWLERHANSLNVPPRKWSTLYRDRLLHPVWMFLARMQARADTRLDSTIRRSRPRLVAADLEKVINHTQELGSPLVYLFELIRPAKRYQSWFPGMAERIDVMNATVEDLVHRIGKPNVRYFRVSELVEQYANGDLEVATPDGFHFSPYMHGKIGEALAREIDEWAGQQQMFDVPVKRTRTRGTASPENAS